MKVLLDTNTVIHREAVNPVKGGIGLLFNWLDKLHIEKCIHLQTTLEIAKHKDQRVRDAFAIKLLNYTLLQTEAPETPEIEALRAKDKNENDQIDTSLLKEVYAERVDFLISEDKAIHTKARTLGISSKVFKIDDFLEKVTIENPELADYKVLSIRRSYFGKLTVADPFFDSFRRDYQGFDRWFNKKAEEQVYLCRADDESIVAFLYVKVEDAEEPYPEIAPPFARKKRLKIGTFKVEMNGYKLGERFLKIIFDNAVKQKVEEVYVTIFDHDEGQKRLIALLEEWGFTFHGLKTSGTSAERVYCRPMATTADLADPRRTYPLMCKTARKFIIAIRPEYHTELLPDSVLRTERPANFIEDRPYRNAICKSYISRGFNRDLRRGDLVVFYRTAMGGPAHHTAVATSLGIVEDVHDQIASPEAFLAHCRKRSVFTEKQLLQLWHAQPQNRPFIVNFLYTYSLPKRPNLGKLKASGVLVEHPRSIDLLTDQGFNTLLQISDANQNLVVDQT